MGSHEQIVTVFGSARPREGEDAYAEAYALGRELAASGFVVCNGGYGGTMEAAAKGACEARPSGLTRTIGVTCAAFGDRAANRWIDREEIANTLFERIERLLALGDAYVVLPGGTGTLLELAAAAEFMNKGMIPLRPLVLLGSTWEPVLATLRYELERYGQPDLSRSLFSAATSKACVSLLTEHLTGGSYGHTHSPEIS